MGVQLYIRNRSFFTEKVKCLLLKKKRKKNRKTNKPFVSMTNVNLFLDIKLVTVGYKIEY